MYLHEKYFMTHESKRKEFDEFLKKEDFHLWAKVKNFITWIPDPKTSEVSPQIFLQKGEKNAYYDEDEARFFGLYKEWLKSE